MLALTLAACFMSIAALNFKVRELSTSGDEPQPRADACMRSFGNEAVLFGGRAGRNILEDTWILRFRNSTWSWSQVFSSSGPTARYAAFCAALPNNRFLLLGGRNEFGVLNTSLVWELDVASRKWRSVVVHPTSLVARAWAVGGILPAGQVVLSHGLGIYGFRRDTVVLNVSDSVMHVRILVRESSPYSFTVPPPLFGAAFATFGDQLFVVGGCLVRGRCPSALAWTLDTTNGLWKRVESAPAPKSGAFLVAYPASKHPLALMLGGTMKSIQMESVPVTSDVLFYRFGGNATWLAERNIHEWGVTRARVGASLVSMLSTFVVFGGTDSQSHTLINITHFFEFNANETMKMSSALRASYTSVVDIHALFMFLTYGIGLPLGLYMARLVRFFSRRRYWFPLHCVSEIASFLLAVVAFVAILFGTPRLHLDNPHGIIGLCIFCFTSVLLFGTLPKIRPRVDAGRRRQIWAAIHRWLGRLTTALGIINCTLGLALYVVHRWVYISWFVYISLLFACFFAVDVYHCFSSCSENTAYEPYDVDTSRLADQSQGVSVDNNKVRYGLDWFPAS